MQKLLLSFMLVSGGVALGAASDTKSEGLKFTLMMSADQEGLYHGLNSSERRYVDRLIRFDVNHIFEVCKKIDSLRKKLAFTYPGASGSFMTSVYKQMGSALPYDEDVDMVGGVVSQETSGKIREALNLIHSYYKSRMFADFTKWDREDQERLEDLFKLRYPLPQGWLML